MRARYANRPRQKKSCERNTNEPPIPLFLNEHLDFRLSKQLVCTITTAYVTFRNECSISHRITKRIRLRVHPVGCKICENNGELLLYDLYMKINMYT